MSFIKSALLFLVFIFSLIRAESQPTPKNPTSSRVFSPVIYNPAVTGSKDYFSLNLISGFRDTPSAQLITGEGRLSKKLPAFAGSKQISGYSNIGLGGAFFHEKIGITENSGGMVSFAYHMPVSKNGISFLSFGAAVKGVQNTLHYSSLSDSSLLQPNSKTLYPNLDLGIYFYSARFYAGISSTNLLGNPGDTDSLGFYEIPVSQQYFFHTGYKIILHRSMNIILEPSVFIEADDSSFTKPGNIIHPALKLYLMDFCMGTYYNDSNSVSMFFQYRYPRFFLGAYFEIPRKSSFNIKEPLIEITAGLTFPGKKTRTAFRSRW